jgi:hypothetical protein
MNARRPHIKNDLSYKMGDKHNSSVNNNDQEFIKFTKGNSHQVKQDNKAANHVSNFDANTSYIPYHAFDISYVLMKNKHVKVIALYIGPRRKRPKTCVCVQSAFI